MTLDLRVSAVYPLSGWSDLGDLYWRVRVFSTKRAMYQYYRRIASPADRADAKESGWAGVCNFDAVVCPRDTINHDKRKPRLHPKLGEVLLWRRRLGSRVLSHEAVHMAAATHRAVGRLKRRNFLRLRQDGNDDAEELFAYTLGHTFGDLVAKLYDARAMKAPSYRENNDEPASSAGSGVPRPPCGWSTW